MPNNGANANPDPEPVAIQVAGVAPKLPCLNRANPEQWFNACNGQFLLAVPRITKESTKFYHCAAKLNEADCTKYRAILAECYELAAADPDNGRPYSTFKAHLLRKAQRSNFQSVQAFNAYKIGDQDPSEALQDLLELWPGGVAHAKTCPAFVGFYVHKLPAAVQTIALQAGSSATLEGIALAHERYLDQARSSVANVYGVDVVDSDDDGFEAYINALQNKPPPSRGRRATAAVEDSSSSNATSPAASRRALTS